MEFVIIARLALPVHCSSRAPVLSEKSSPAAVARVNVPAPSETAVISAENVSHSGCFVTRVASEAGQVG